jgi:predicted nucleic acid-binding protein
VASDPEMIVWEATCVELLSALARYRRHSTGFDDLWPGIRQTMLERWVTWSRVSDMTKTVPRAQRLVTIHPLKAADALQLAAALVACEEQPHLLPFVTRDRALAQAARLEGFTAIMITPVTTPA